MKKISISLEHEHKKLFVAFQFDLYDINQHWYQYWCLFVSLWQYIFIKALKSHYHKRFFFFFCDYVQHIACYSQLSAVYAGGSIKLSLPVYKSTFSCLYFSEANVIHRILLCCAWNGGVFLVRFFMPNTASYLAKLEYMNPLYSCFIANDVDGNVFSLRQAIDPDFSAPNI